jgi:hypothetical protein
MANLDVTLSSWQKSLPKTQVNPNITKQFKKWLNR